MILRSSGSLVSFMDIRLGFVINASEEGRQIDEI